MDEKEEKNIEVELKYQPTEEQLADLLEGSEKLSEEEIHDIYFDFSDFRLLKKGDRLRYRIIKTKEKEGGIPLEVVGFFELKIGLGSKTDLEIKNRERIKEYLEKEAGGIKEFFDTGKGLEEIVVKKEGKFIPIVDFKTERRKYIKEGFIIDVDEVNYGPNEEKYNICEVEVMLENENEEKIKETKEKIEDFVKKYNFDTEKKVIPKGWEYLRRFNKEIYDKIYVPKLEEKAKNREIKKVLNNEINLK